MSRRNRFVVIPFLLVLSSAAVTAAAAQGSEVRTGAAAFGDWRADNPGVRRLIRPEDLPAPSPEESTSNRPLGVAMPDGAKPKVGEDFRVDLVAEGLDRPRVVRTAPNGDLFVADSGADNVRVYRMADGEAEPEAEEIFASGLDRPYGIAFYPPGDDPEWVYVANQDSVVRFPYSNGDLEAAGDPETIVPDLPTGGHWTRDIAFSPDGERLFVSVGSGSNVAEGMSEPPSGFVESHALGAAWGSEERRAAVLSYDPNGQDERLFATGIRNCSGLAVEPGSGDLWCATNERDGLGDNVPFEFVTAVEEGAFYGWPWYYIGPNEDPRHVGARPDLADKVTIPDVLLQAHSAPLAMTFYDGQAFPRDYRGDAFVTLHGSWNRGEPTGYKVVRVLFEDGEPTGEYEDFMTGFVISDEMAWGRPVGVAVAKDGSLIVTEDGSGTIWRVARTDGPS